MSNFPVVAHAVAVADPFDPTRAVKPNADGSLNTLGTIYNTVAASATKQALKGNAQGATGSTGDVLGRLIIIPATTSPGAVQIFDSSSGSAITVFPGGASSVTALTPVQVDLGAKSTAGAWCVTTGASVSVIAVGQFS